MTQEQEAKQLIEEITNELKENEKLRTALLELFETEAQAVAFTAAVMRIENTYKGVTA